MAKVSLRNGNGARSPSTTKYDAHHTVLSKTYGALADLRRELADSKAAVSGRNDIPYNLRVQMDVYYVNFRNFWLDLWLIIKTIGVIVFPKNNGAY